MSQTSASHYSSVISTRAASASKKHTPSSATSVRKVVCKVKKPKVERKVDTEEKEKKVCRCDDWDTECTCAEKEPGLLLSIYIGQVHDDYEAARALYYLAGIKACIANTRANRFYAAPFLPAGDGIVKRSGRPERNIALDEDTLLVWQTGAKPEPLRHSDNKYVRRLRAVMRIRKEHLAATSAQ